MSIRYSPLSVLIPFYLFFLHLFILTVAVDFPTSYSLVDNLAINCGSSGNSTTPDGREWIGDVGLKFARLQQQKSKTVTLKSFPQLSDKTDPVPYRTARVSRSRFSYTFEVNPGQKIIRLHFYPALYRGFERSKAFFTVKAGPHTLLSNFSASLTADSLGLKSFAKEFCLNVGKYQALNITFFPSPGSSSDPGYAFINGIEIVSMPTGLYYSQSSDPGSPVVGQNYRIHIENSTALELVQRLNVGGSSISSAQDSGMLREWSEDSNYLIESGAVPISTTIPIKYLSMPSYLAPQKLYQTAWSIGVSKQSNQMNSFTWKLPVDLGFRYLLRLHFCELEYGIKERGQREFCILINEQIAEAYADLIEWGGGNGVAVYRDYVVVMEGDRMEGKRDLVIALRAHCHDQKTKNASNPILNGLEVFKLSNPDNNLAGPNPASLAAARTSKAPKTRKLASVVDGGNAIVNGVIIVITLVNIIVHRLCVWAENSDKKNIPKLFPKEMCRHFSLADMQLATNNFDDERIIGRGGFGKVYIGIINKGATNVAIKRLDSKSKQGAHEFWTEIGMLSELRHTHLVTLIGYCDDFQEMILVYEYMAHGTLADHVHTLRRNSYRISRLTWEQRLNICVGAARGLNYLHNGTSQAVIHRDVKSTNILLDENWVAKISDFGLSKMGFTSQSRSYVSTNVKGTFGYLDPEYYSTHRLTKKSDVYAFGVVLFEVLCGRPAVDMRLEEEQHSLALWAQHCIREEMLHQIVDPHLTTQISPSCLKVFAEVAKKCLHNSSKNRPTMDDIVGSLELAVEAQKSSKSLGSCTDDAAIGVGGAENQQNDEAVQPAAPAIGFAWWRRRKPREIFFDVLAAEDPEVRLGQLRRFSLRELQVATDIFSNKNILRRSVFGKVYKGRLADGTLVAVKRLKEERTPEGELQFQIEVEMIRMAVHRNLLLLRGFCMTPTERLLVYPYMANGSVASWLRERPPSEPPLDWPTRKRIALGSARGLSYLHDHCDPKIIYRDVKAANILLDEEFEAVVGGFGLAKLMDYKDTHVTTAVRGTIGHIAPEYLFTGKISEKTNVFGYGIVLLELITGQTIFDLTRLANDDDIMLLDWVLKEKKLEMRVDPDLQTNYVDSEVELLIQVALLCTQRSPMDRPKMSEVVRMLEGDGLA